VQGLVASGRFDEVPLDGDSFKSYLNLKPFDKLLKKVAAINQAEIHVTTLMPYLVILQSFGFKTLGDVENFIKDNFDAAYQLAVFQIGNTDLDIIASNVAIQDLCVVHILRKGDGVVGLSNMFNFLGGTPDSNRQRAARIVEEASSLPFMNK